MKRALFAVSVASVLATMSIVGCGGSDDEEETPAGDGAGGSTAGSAGTGGSTAGSSGKGGSGGSTAGAGGAGAGGAGAGGAGAGGAGAGGAGAGGAGAGGAGAGGAGAGGGGAGGAANADYTCLPAPADAKPASTDVTFDFYLLEKKLAGADAPVPNYKLKACAKDDATCATPLDTQTTDTAGKVTFKVKTSADGFDGYIEAADPAVTTYVPALIYLGNHFVIGNPKNAAAPWGASIFSTSTFGAGAAVAGVAPVNAADGHIVQVSYDCAFAKAPGLTLEAAPTDGTTKVIYVAGATPSKTATQTDATGAAFVFNVPPGSATVTAKQGTTTIGTSKVLVRAGAMTVVFNSPKQIPQLCSPFGHPAPESGALA